MKFITALFKRSNSIASDAIGAIKDMKETIELKIEEKDSDFLRKQKKNMTTVKLIRDCGLKHL